MELCLCHQINKGGLPTSIDPEAMLVELDGLEEESQKASSLFYNYSVPKRLDKAYLCQGPIS